MPITMTATDARVHFGELLRAVNETNEPMTIEKNGEPVAVVLSPTQYHRLKSQQKSGWWQLVQEPRRAFAPLRERGELPDPAELINEEREKRDQQLVENLLPH
jgi:prevent-host-death family protein